MIRAEEQASGAIKLGITSSVIRNASPGATFDPQLRLAIQDSDLISLDQCHYQVLEQPDGYHGAMEPGCKCIVQRNGKDTVLVSSFHLQETPLRPSIAVMTRKPMSVAGARWRDRSGSNELKAGQPTWHRPGCDGTAE